MNPQDIQLIDDTETLGSWLADQAHEGDIVRTRLKADERVIARVTDGIYREPASAFRELISNAWDADATDVSILTDAPRFSRVYIRDNGTGMSHQALSHLLHAIGGSAKRRESGKALGITGDDVDRTPKGRLLIGKIGIGLFSVSQLARRFHLITKTSGTNYRLSAEIRLRAYSEDPPDDAVSDSDDSFVTADVFLHREHSEDIEAHGTDIVLEDIKPRVRDLLRSNDRWTIVAEHGRLISSDQLDLTSSVRAEPPIFHSGWIGHLTNESEAPAILDVPANLPWTANDAPENRMSMLMDGIEAQFSRVERPDLRKTLDSYLEMIWTVALSVPVCYVHKHPFELSADDGISAFWINNKTHSQSRHLQLSKWITVRQAVLQQVGVNLQDGAKDPVGGFRVFIDNIELKRPIRFKFFQTERRGLDKPILFVGSYEPNLSGVNSWQRGGELSTEGYLFWNGRIIPKENNGVLVRIRGTSSGRFDSTFFSYPVLELTRLRQITAELFVKQGLDAAQNIDRETFNFGHPHIQLIINWLHRSLRQLTNKLKELSAITRSQRQLAEAAQLQDAVSSWAASVWRDRRPDDDPPDVGVFDAQSAATEARKSGVIAIDRKWLYSTSAQVDHLNTTDTTVKALTTVLAAFRVFDDMTYDDQQALIGSILRLFGGGIQ